MSEEYCTCQMCGQTIRKASMMYVNNILMCVGCVEAFANIGIIPSKPKYAKECS